MDKLFEPGMFITWKTKEGSFGIFEGNDISESVTYKKLTLLCFFDPEKFVETSSMCWEKMPNLDVASKTKKCERTVDTLKEDNWWRCCTEEEKKTAIELLDAYGYTYSEELKCLIDNETGEIIKKIFIPKIEYDGRKIKPSKLNMNQLLKKYANDKAAPSYNYNNVNSRYPYGGYGEEDWYD